MICMTWWTMLALIAFVAFWTALIAFQFGRGAMSDEKTCTCLTPTQLAQMMARNEVVQSRYPCPVHPEPTYPAGTFLPRIESAEAIRILRGEDDTP